MNFGRVGKVSGGYLFVGDVCGWNDVEVVCLG